MTQKRRIIYMTDQEWAGVLERAAYRKMSASAFIRKAVELPAPFSLPEFRPAPKPGRSK